MEYRDLGEAGRRVSEISLGTWALPPAVACAIPGGKNPSQIEDNVAAADMSPFSGETMQRAREIYDGHVRDEVHHRW